jgi:hypothetical protein
VQGEVLPQANGSARVTIAHSGTQVLAAVKVMHCTMPDGCMLMLPCISEAAYWDCTRIFS